MDIKAVALIGIKIEKDEYNFEFDTHLKHDTDCGQKWLQDVKPYLTQLLDCYVFSEYQSKTSEDTESILFLHHKLNYYLNSKLIAAFKTYFPSLDIETHQLDMYLGLQTS